MLPPGAQMSRQVPKLEKLDLASLRSEDATVIAAGSRAGVKLQALSLLLPAARAKTTPEAMALRTAVSIPAWVPRAPRLMLATAGFCALAATQSMASAI